MWNQIERLRRYTNVLKHDFTRSQAAKTTFFGKSMIEDLFMPTVHAISQTEPPTPHETLHNIQSYSPSINKNFYGILKKLADQLKYDSSPTISLTRSEIETLYKGAPTLELASQQIDKNISINKKHCQGDKVTDLQQQAANIRELQHKLDIFVTEFLFPTQQYVPSGPGLSHHRR